MIIDNLSIIFGCIIVLLTAISIVANPFARSISRKEDNNVAKDGNICETLPKISVVVLSHNNAEALDKHLPLILTQDYAPGYEVIVVGEKGDTNVEGVLNKYAHNSLLYATFIPQQSLFMSKPKLSAALGIKAARNEWIVMLDATCKPMSDEWLKSVANSIKSGTNLVVGYSNYEDEAKAYYRFIRLRESCYYLHTASYSTAYRSTGSNIAFKRTEFIQRDGYRGNLQHVYGEYDFIINKFARQGATSVVTHPDSFLREDSPTKKNWSERCIANSHVGYHLERSISTRLAYVIDVVFMYLCYMANIATGAFAYMTSRYPLLAIGVVCLLAAIGMRIWLVKVKCRQLNEHLSSWKIPFFELSLVWFDLITLLKYAKADKHDFTTHKI